MALKTVLMFRHGETNWNREHRLQGNTDIPLNETGRAQAEDLARRLAKMNVELFLSSDLSRALDTARTAIRLAHAPLVVIPELRETRLGEAEGLTEAELIARFGREARESWRSLAAEHEHYAFPGGESKFEHRQRLLTALECALLRFNETRIAVSTHGGAIRRLVHGFRPDLVDPAMIPNCKIFEFTFDSKSQRWSIDNLEPK